MTPELLKLAHQAMNRHRSDPQSASKPQRQQFLLKEPRLLLLLLRS